MKRFFVIDDDGRDMEKLERLLREHGFSATELEMGEDDRTRAHEELRRTNDTLRAVIEAAPTAIVGLDLEGNVRDVWNPAAEKMLGWSAQEVMGRPLPSVPVESREEFSRFREWIRSGRTMNGVEVRRRKRDGTPIEYSIYASPLHDSEGRIIGNIAVLVDISERKRAEEALRESENRYRLIVETADEGIWQLDREWKTTYVNRRMEQMLGYEPGSMSGLQLCDFMDDEGRRAVAELIARREQGIRETHDFRFVRRDGSWIDTLVSASPVVDEQGDFAGSFAMVTDITERKRMEYELQLSQFCIDKAFIGIFRGGPDARIRFVNEYGARMLGYSQEELLSMSFFDIDTCLTPQWWEEHRRNLTAAGSAKFETVHRRKDGTTFPVEVTVNYLKYHDYEFSCSFSQDITERKRTESVMSARMRLLEFAATHTLDELLEATLNEAEELTGSCIGFYHYLEPDQKTLSLQNWSTRTKKDFCRAEGKGRHYDVSAAGVWVDCIHQRRPVIHNDYDSLPHRKGLPPGHAPVTRELVVPVFRGDSIVAVFGVGNKSHDYTPQDVETVSLLTDLAWGIAGQKRVEDALRASEWKYRAIIEHAPFGISRSTRDGRLLSANPAMAGILKYDSPEELLETVNRSSVQDVLFEDPSLRDILVERIFAGSSWHVFENRYRCKDGSVITCKVHSRRILGKEGGGRVFESFLENITERLEAEKALRESEEKFRVLAETSPTAIFLYQGEMIVYANPATERLFGYGADELLRMRFWDWAHDDFRELVRDRGLARLRGEPVPGQYESRFVTRAGEDRWLVVAAGLIDYHGRATGVASFLDITEIKKAEEQVRSSLAEKEILLKEVHHRVKNNLQIISSLLDLQSDYILEEHSRRFIRESQDRIRSMALVHEQLYKSEDLAFIDFARYVDELVTSLCQSCMVSQERVRVRVAVRDIELGIDEAIPCGLIINELVSNALKHAFPGDTRGEVFIRGAMGEEGVVCLSVADSGVGLPPGLDFLNTESLGLQIVNLLTSQLRGTIDMQGDKGVTVTICFRVNPKG